MSDRSLGRFYRSSNQTMRRVRSIFTVSTAPGISLFPTYVLCVCAICSLHCVSPALSPNWKANMTGSGKRVNWLWLGKGICNFWRKRFKSVSTNFFEFFNVWSLYRLLTIVKMFTLLIMSLNLIIPIVLSHVVASQKNLNGCFDKNIRTKTKELSDF